MSNIPRVPFVLLLTTLAAALPAGAQSPLASVRGSVLDPNRVGVPSATITVTDAATGEVRTTMATDAGDFVVSAVRSGVHRVEITADGYKRSVQHLALSVGQELRTQVVLELGAITEQVDVVAEVPLIRRESAAMGTTVDNRLVSTLPLDGRNFLDLTLLVAGAAPAAQGAAGTVRGDFTFNVSGARDDANAFLLDGADNIDPKLNTAGVRPPLDAIREFEVRTSTHEASYGRQAGAQVNVALKSGTNTLSGTAYEFYRGALDARNAFASRDLPAPDYQRHQFGGTIGGPIVANRTFFFGSIEGTRRREGITHVTTVPTVAERAGDFSASLLPAPIDPTTGRPFAGGRVPEFFMSPVGRAIANLYPLPNRPGSGGNFVSSPEERDDVDQFDVRVTHAWSPATRLSARHSFSDRRLFEPFSGPGFAAVPGFGTEVPRRAQQFVADLTSVVGSTLTNEVRFGYTRVSGGAFQENASRNLNAEVGLPAPWTSERDQGLSFISVSGFSPLGDEYNNPQHGRTNAYQVSDVVTWARGGHLVKLGGDLRFLQQDAYRDVQARGLLSFASIPYITGNALADLLLGYPLLTGRARVDNPQHLRTSSYGLFVQDSYRVTRDLTLAAGVRYEYQSPPADRDDRASVYDPATRTIVQVGTNGVPRGVADPDRNNLAPRVGLTWAVAGRTDTVARAGYGLYYNQTALAPSEGLYFSPPYYQFDFFVPLPGLAVTLNDPFPSRYPLAFPSSALAFDRDLQTPSLQQWNVGIARQISGAMTADVSYVGSRGDNLIGSRDFNQAAPSPAAVNLRPDPRFADILIVESRVSSRYHSLQTSLQRRADRGLSFLVSYAWSTSKDDVSGFFSNAGDASFPQDSNNPGAEWGRSAFDVRHRLSASFVCALPMGADALSGTWLGALADGWQVAGILTLQSGRPFTVGLLPDIDNSNTGRANLGFGFNDRPNVVGDPTLDDPSAARYFNTAAFALPPYGSFGDAGRNILEGPGYANVSLSILKQIELAGDVRLQLRLESFNLFNRVNYDIPDAFLGSPTFGQLLSAQPPRRVQFGAKLMF